MKKDEKNIVSPFETLTFHIILYQKWIVHSSKTKVRTNGNMNGLFKERLPQEHSVAHMRITTPTISHSCSSCAVHLVAWWPHGQSEGLADGPYQKSQRSDRQSACWVGRT